MVMTFAAQDAPSIQASGEIFRAHGLNGVKKFPPLVFLNPKLRATKNARKHPKWEDF
jgi:hypothetical protein